MQTKENRGVTNKASHINEFIDGTIERLGRTPDLYYLHRIDPDTPLEESITALDGLKKAGKCKYIGLSEPSAQTLRKACKSTWQVHRDNPWLTTLKLPTSMLCKSNTAHSFSIMRRMI
jgi:aryl-alcohol dehydrogenase-like predicted oxidoreductase